MLTSNTIKFYADKIRREVRALEELTRSASKEKEWMRSQLHQQIDEIFDANT